MEDSTPIVLQIGANSPSNVATITRRQTKVACSAVITARGKNCFICSFLSELKWGYLNNLLTLIKIAALLRIRKQRAGVQMNQFFRCLAFPSRWCRGTIYYFISVAIDDNLKPPLRVHISRGAGGAALLGRNFFKHRSRCARIHLSFLKPGRGFLARRHNLPDGRQHSDSFENRCK